MIWPSKFHIWLWSSPPKPPHSAFYSTLPISFTSMKLVFVINIAIVCCDCSGCKSYLNYVT